MYNIILTFIKFNNFSTQRLKQAQAVVSFILLHYPVYI